jgi:hypothetical protein
MSQLGGRREIGVAGKASNQLSRGKGGGYKFRNVGILNLMELKRGEVR